ncbi:hypothetical protein TNCV_4914761 [Trichonephila clavipes]|nr:hypothetical protein TNCV_4914761 [Trichonephila clavipes]
MGSPSGRVSRFHTTGPGSTPGMDSLSNRDICSCTSAPNGHVYWDGHSWPWPSWAVVPLSLSNEGVWWVSRERDKARIAAEALSPVEPCFKTSQFGRTNCVKYEKCLSMYCLPITK